MTASAGFTDQNVVPYGLLVMYAMDCHRDGTCPPNATRPLAPPPSGVILGFIVGSDTVDPRHPAYAPGPIQLLAQLTCYGVVVQRPNNEVVVAIRGTDGIAEWIEDAEFVFKPYAPTLPLPAGTTARVEQGFWGIYASLNYVDLQGVVIGSAAATIATLYKGASSIVVSGHSLGGPLATYLALDLARVDPRQTIRGCYFASPHPGDDAFAAFFQETIGNYVVYNYVMDVVPRMPPTNIGYTSLANRRVITPALAKAEVTLGLGCNHHIVCYLAMLDYPQTLAALNPVPAAEINSWSCVRGPGVGRDSLAAMLFDRVAEVATA